MTAIRLCALGAEAAPLLAALHRAAFPLAEAWGADAIALMLAMPGAFALCATHDAGADGVAPGPLRDAGADGIAPGALRDAGADGVVPRARRDSGAEDAAPVGFVLARVAADEAEILTLAVAPEARRVGAGTALLHGAAVAAAGRGARVLFLEVSEANRPARALYEAAGFAEAGRRRRYYADGSDALVLRLSLPCGSGGG